MHSLNRSDLKVRFSNPIVKSVPRDGRIVIPAGYRKKLGIRPGDDVVLLLGKGELRVCAWSEALRRIRARIQGVVPKKGVSETADRAQ